MKVLRWGLLSSQLTVVGWLDYAPDDEMAAKLAVNLVPLWKEKRKVGKELCLIYETGS